MSRTVGAKEMIRTGFFWNTNGRRYR